MELDESNVNDTQSSIFATNSTNFNSSQRADSDLWTQANFREIAVYSVLFVIAAIGNLTVFISLFRSRHRKSRISLMITHLAIADLIVTFYMIPLEVAWRLTGGWLAGNVACKVFLFLRVLGPYLSSNILVCISLDRYFAVLYPLRVNDARRRGKVMLSIAWSTSFIYCIPQSFVFSVKTHPEDPNFTQCVSYYFFTSPTQEKVYNFLCVLFMYFIPLLIIVGAYTAIMREILRNSNSMQNESQPLSDGRMRLRRSAVSNIEKAKSRTLKMTITIVAVYIACCTPPAMMTLWYMIDRTSAEHLPDWLKEASFVMVVTNSCMNPIIYGSYAIKCKRNCKYVSCMNKRRTCNVNDGEIQTSHGSRDFVRRLLKCFLRPKKGDSPTTKSTGSKNTLAQFKIVNGTLRMREFRQYEPKEERSQSAGCPPSAARVSFAESSTSNHSQGMSFYSEPLTNPLGFICDDNKLSQPDLSGKTNLVMNIHQVKVQYHHREHPNNLSLNRNM